MLEKRISSFRANAEDPFWETWQAGLAAGLRFYAESGAMIDSKTQAAIAGDLVYRREGLPHPFDARFAVGGMTRGKNVEITVTASLFDWQSLLATPYVVLHELICHAFAEGSASSGAVEDWQAFPEGWMDTIALQVHDESALPYGSARESAATELHEARYRKTREESAVQQLLATAPPERRHERLRGAWQIGRNAARSTERVFQGIVGDEKGRRGLWRLSAALNRSGLPPVKRYRFAAAASRLLDPDRTLERGSELEDLLHASARELLKAISEEDLRTAAARFALGLIQLDENRLDQDWRFS